MQLAVTAREKKKRWHQNLGNKLIVTSYILGWQYIYGVIYDALVMELGSFSLATEMVSSIKL